MAIDSKVLEDTRLERVMIAYSPQTPEETDRFMRAYTKIAPDSLVLWGETSLPSDRRRPSEDWSFLETLMSYTKVMPGSYGAVELVDDSAREVGEKGLTDLLDYGVKVPVMPLHADMYAHGKHILVVPSEESKYSLTKKTEFTTGVVEDRLKGEVSGWEDAVGVDGGHAFPLPKAYQHLFEVAKGQALVLTHYKGQDIGGMSARYISM